jgi:hypothetical protein
MLEIALPPDTEAKLRERAKASGEDVSAVAARLIAEALGAPSVDELLAPFRKQVEDGGVTDEDLDRLGDELRDEVWRQHQTRKS